MSLKWKNAMVLEPPKQTEKKNDKSDKSSKRFLTQRKYKVRFKSDLHEAKVKRRKARHDALGMEAWPALTDERGGGGKPAVESTEGTEGTESAECGEAQDGRLLQDASLLYFFTETAQGGEQMTDMSPGQQMQLQLSPLPSDESSETGHGDANDAAVSVVPVGTVEDRPTPTPPTPTTTSPQLTFQADILPNIPRQLPFASTWTQGRSEKRMYLQYSLTPEDIERVVPRLMPLWKSADNPLVSIVIPASTESEILTHAIIALSSYHLSVQPNSDGHGFEVLRHKQKVLTLLRENLAKPDVLRDDATLAACMLMQTFEVLYCGTSGWDHWLKGATLLLRLRGRLESDLKDANSWIRLAKCVVAIETFASTSARFEPLISEDYWNIYRRMREDYLQSMSLDNSKRMYEHEHSEDEHFEKLVGCPVVIVYSLGRMAMLRQSREEVEAAGGASISTSESTSEASTIAASTATDPDWYSTWSIESIKLEYLLIRWRPRETTPDRAHLFEAFRQAALVFYYRKVRRFDYAHATVQHHVQRTFHHLEQLSPASDVDNISLWPTMMAAIGIDEDQNAALTQVAIKRIRGMSCNIRDPLYTNAENALNLLWSLRREATTKEAKAAVDWDELSQEMQWQWCFV